MPLSLHRDRPSADWLAGWSGWGFRGARPRLLIHAGLHKTGTTSLQNFLSAHAGDLRDSGILYPRAGRFPAGGTGHHNIAWQVTGDRRFTRALGTIDELAAEISDFGGHAIISSEDFESGLSRPKVFSRLSSHPLLRAHHVLLIAYVRHQGAYLESLYPELLKHGLSEPLSTFAQPLFAEQRLRFRDWVFEFDYARLSDSWRWRRAARLVLRPYPSAPGESVIVDFVSVACPNLEDAACGWAVRANARDAVQTGRFAASLDACFAPSNRRLQARTGIRLVPERDASTLIQR